MSLNSTSFESIRRDLFSEQPTYSAITEETEATLSTYQKIIANNTNVTEFSEGTETASSSFQQIQDTLTEESVETELLQYEKIQSINTAKTEGTEATLSSFEKIAANTTDLSEETQQVFPKTQDDHTIVYSSIKSIKSNDTKALSDENIQFFKSGKLSLQVYKKKGEERLETVLQNKKPPRHNSARCVTLSANDIAQGMIEMNLSTLSTLDESVVDDSKENIVSSENKVDENPAIEPKKTEKTRPPMTSCAPRVKNKKSKRKNRNIFNFKRFNKLSVRQVKA